MYKMKTKIFALITLFLVSVGINAQIDRSKQPKPGPAPKISLEVPGEFELPKDFVPQGTLDKRKP